jgi:hypothetical protein
LTADYFNEIETTYRFEPDLSIQFQDKERLYKRTAAPIVSIYRYAAVAASTIVTGGLIWWFMGTASVDQTLVKTEVSVTTEGNSIESINNLPQTDNTNSSVPKLNATNQVAFVVDRKGMVVTNSEQQNTGYSPIEEDVNAFIVREQLASPINTDQSKSNFSQEALQAAHSRMDAAVSNVSISNAVPVNTAPAINTAMLIEAEMDNEKQVPVRGLLRKISRTLLRERNEEDDNQKYIQLAVFSIPVQK